MAIKINFIFLFSFLLLFQYCKQSEIIRPPTNSEIERGLEEAKNSERELETELRLIKDLNQGIIQAKKEEKPILLIFTAFGAINSRKLEHEVILKNENVFSLMKDKFINVWLYVDDRTANGNKWNTLQLSKFHGNHQPQIFILDSNGNKLDGGIGYQESKEELLPLLKKYGK